MDRGLWPLPWHVPSIPTAGPPSPRQPNKNKRCLTHLPQRRCMHAVPSLLLPKADANLWPSRYFRQSCPSMLVISWCLGARGKAECFPAPNPMVTFTALAPNAHPVTLSSGLPSGFLVHLPVGGERFSPVIATCFINRMNDTWHNDMWHFWGLFPHFHQSLGNWHGTAAHALAA